MLRIVVMGPPGSGKGTRAKIIGRMYGIPVIAAGDMLREVASRGTDRGKVAKAHMNRGELVPDDIVISIMEERLNKPDTEGGFVLDGFPRSMRQAMALDRILERQKATLDTLLYVAAKPETIVGRLSLRRSCPKCGAVYHLRDMPPKEEGVCDECGSRLIQREDDTEEIILHRFEVYERQTFPILERYQEAGKMEEISGDLDIDQIPAAIEEILGKPQVL
ncbi:MAG: adenylate kinase [Candidatus Bathyarchaeota archaeon]|nr:adenylate kinase [Candidatus Bathyarchaeota archaeon]